MIEWITVHMQSLIWKRLDILLQGATGLYKSQSFSLKMER